MGIEARREQMRSRRRAQLEGDVKRLADLKARLQRRLEDLQQELEELQLVLSFLDEALAERSFRRTEASPPSTVAPVAAPQPEPSQPAQVQLSPASPVEYRQVIPLKSSDGLLLGTMYVGEEDARIVPSSDLRLNVSIPPFQPFFVNRVLEPMVKRDQEAVASGELQPGGRFSYEVVEEGGLLKEVIVRNYGDERRLREVRSSARWTLDKMYEKTRSS